MSVLLMRCSECQQGALEEIHEGEGEVPMSLLESSLWRVEESGADEARWRLRERVPGKLLHTSTMTVPFVKPSLGHNHNSRLSWLILGLQEGRPRDTEENSDRWRMGSRSQNLEQLPGRFRLPAHVRLSPLGSWHRNWPQASSPGKRCLLGAARFPCVGCRLPSGSPPPLLSHLQAAICPRRNSRNGGV